MKKMTYFAFAIVLIMCWNSCMDSSDQDVLNLENGNHTEFENQLSKNGYNPIVGKWDLQKHTVYFLADIPDIDPPILSDTMVIDKNEDYYWMEVTAFHNSEFYIEGDMQIENFPGMPGMDFELDGGWSTNEGVLTLLSVHFSIVDDYYLADCNTLILGWINNPGTPYEMYNIQEFVRLPVPWDGNCKDDDLERVAICHIPPGNPSNAHMITVGASAVAAHLGHGDTLGPCSEPQPQPR